MPISSNQTTISDLVFGRTTPTTPAPATPFSDPSRGVPADPIEARGRAGADFARAIIPPIWQGFVNMARDAKNAIGNYPQIAVATVKDLFNPMAMMTGEAPAMERVINSMPEEEVKSTIRGGALVAASGAAGVAGNAVRSIGASLISETAPISARIALGASKGAIEGAAFAEVFGPLHQMAEDGRINSDALFAEIVGMGIFGGALGAGGAAWSATRGPRMTPQEFEAVLEDGLAQAVAERADLVLRRTLPEIPSPTSPEELVAQVAAGVTSQSPTRSGLVGTMNDMGRGALDFLQTRFPEVKGLDPSTWSLGLRLADSRNFGAWFASRSTELVEVGLTKPESEIFWKSLVESRFNQVRQDLMEQATSLQVGERVKINGRDVTAAELKTLAENVPAAVLTPEERFIFQASPAIKSSLERYQSMVLPLLTQMRTRNGLRSFVKTDLPFVPLVPATPEMMEAGIATLRTRPMGGGTREGVLGQATATTTPGAKRALAQADAYVVDGKALMTQVMSREGAIDRKNELLANIVNAPWARRLNPGERAPRTILVEGKEVPAEVLTITGNPEVLKNRFGITIASEQTVLEDMGIQAAREAQIVGGASQRLIEPPRSNALSERQPLDVGDLIPEEGLGGGIPLPGEVAEPILGRYVVPRSVRRMVGELTTREGTRRELLTLSEATNPIFRGYARAMDFSTGLLLASPVEFTAHSLRVFSRVASIPTIVGGDAAISRRIADKFALWFGPRANAMREIFSVYSKPEDFLMEAKLAEIPGGLPSRAFEGEVRGGIGALASKIGGPHAAEGMEIGRKALFNLPEQRPITLKGLISGDMPITGIGVDIRARVVAAKALERMTLKEIGREPTRAEFAEFLQQFGSYSETVQSNLQAALRANRVNPFAANLSTLTSEVRSFLGGTNLPRTVLDEMSTAAAYRYKAEVLMRMTLPTALVTAFTQKALVGSWPWENETGFKDDLLVGYTEDGRGVYVPLTTLEPDFARGARIVGARALLESVGKDLGTPAADALREIANTAITYTLGAPGTGAMAAITTGSAPYITGEGEILSVVPPEPTDILTIKNRFLSVAHEANPTIEALLGVGAAGVEGSTGNFIRFLNATTPGVRVGRERLLAGSSEFRSDEARRGDIVFERVTRALGEFENHADRVRFYREESENFPERRLQIRAFQEMLQLDTRLRASQRRTFVRARVEARR